MEANSLNDGHGDEMTDVKAETKWRTWTWNDGHNCPENGDNLQLKKTHHNMWHVPKF